MFYAQFAKRYADDAERETAVKHLRAYADNYLKRDWSMNCDGTIRHFARDLETSFMKRLAPVYAVYELTGDRRYHDAVRVQLRKLIDAGLLPWLRNPFVVSHNLWYWTMLCDYWLQTELAGEFDWRDCIRQYASVIPNVVDADGLVLFGEYDTARHTFEPYADRWLTRRDDNGDWMGPAPNRIERTWVSARNWSNRAFTSASLAMGALIARRHGLSDEAKPLARKILHRLDEDTLRWWWDDGGLPVELKPLTNIFHPEVAAFWQAVYWMGRADGLW
jgi:hypothetical protein